MSDHPQITNLEPDVVDRLYAHDYSLWPEPAPGDGGGDWLGWLDLPDELEFADWITTAGLPSADELGPDCTDVVVLGMGGSSLTSAVLADLARRGKLGTPSRHLTVLDTVNPLTIREFIEKSDLERCHFIVASKSGTTTEPLSLESIFRNELQQRGIEPADRFTAISDPGTPLAERAADGQFRRHIATPPNVGGRYSALTAFGTYPASLCGLLTNKFVQPAVVASAHLQTPAPDNGVWDLAARIVGHAAQGRDKLTFVASESMVSFGMWLEQLVAESTGKIGHGLVPVVNEPRLGDLHYGDDRFIVALSTQQDPPVDMPPGHESLDLRIPDASKIGGMFYVWEVAVAWASSGLGVYPFDQPNVESAKQYARQVLESEEMPEIEAITLADAVKSACANADPGRYVALCAFLPESPELTAVFSDLRAAISRSTKMATTFGYGPRYLHSTGQQHKGGTDSIIQIVIVQDDSEFDMAVPGAGYTLGQLSRSQAVGDVLAMRGLGRQSAFVEIGQDAIEDVKAVAKQL